MRAELSAVRRVSNECLWGGWEADADAVQVEVCMLSGKTFGFSVGARATGAEVRERAAGLAGMPAQEVGLICDGSPVRDEEVLLDTRQECLSGPAPQLQLLRRRRPRVLSTSHDSSLRMWDPESARQLKVLKGHGDAVISVDVDWVSQCALSGAHDCTLRLWDLDHGVCVDTMETPGHPAFCVAMDYGSRRAATGSWDMLVKVWDLDSGACTHSLRGHQELVSCLAVDWAGARALSGSYY